MAKEKLFGKDTIASMKEVKNLSKEISQIMSNVDAGNLPKDMKDIAKASEDMSKSLSKSINYSKKNYITVSLAVNILLGWYVKGLLQKFMFISQNVADLYLTTKAFRVFVTSLYSMDSYYGEPMIQELIEPIKTEAAEQSLAI